MSTTGGMLATDLTLKQARFVEEYIVDLNGKQAAIRTGYSPRTAEVQASRLLSNAKVHSAVKQAMQARSRRTGITADRVLIELAELAFSNISDFLQVQRDGSVQIDLARASRDRSAAVHDVILSTPAEGSDDEVRITKLTRVELFDKLRALEMLARHLGMYPSTESRGRYPRGMLGSGSPR
jgi:phage terminase small subunit